MKSVDMTGVPLVFAAELDKSEVVLLLLLLYLVSQISPADREQRDYRLVILSPGPLEEKVAEVREATPPLHPTH